MTTTDPAERVDARDKMRYVRALRFRWLTRFYDPILRATLRDDIFKRTLIERAGIRPGHRVLDIGCGTGTLTVMAKQYSPHARVVGLDVDPDALAQARARIAAAGVDVELYEASAIAPPFQSASFDRILSSLVLHHLTTGDKRRVFAAVHTLLVPGGEFHLVDWGPPQNALMRLAFLPVQMLDGFANTADNVRGRLIPLMREGGFSSITETRRMATVFGTLAFYRAI